MLLYLFQMVIIDPNDIPKSIEDAAISKDKSIAEVLGEDVLFPCMYIQLGSAYGYLQASYLI